MIAGRPACRVLVCRLKDPPGGGCSYVDCPHRRPLTASPGRAGDGKIPPRGSETGQRPFRYR